MENIINDNKDNGQTHVGIENIEFGLGSVPVSHVAKVLKKDSDWIRAGIIAGWLPIGFATRNNMQIKSINEMSQKKGRIRYFISPKKLYEETGYIWRG